MVVDTERWILLLLWFLAAGVGIGCAETAEHAAVATAAPTEVRGSAFGLLAGVQSFGKFVGSTLAGVLWVALSPSWAFGLLATVMVCATALFVSGRRSA